MSTSFKNQSACDVRCEPIRPALVPGARSLWLITGPAASPTCLPIVHRPALPCGPQPPSTLENQMMMGEGREEAAWRGEGNCKKASGSSQSLVLRVRDRDKGKRWSRNILPVYRIIDLPKCWWINSDDVATNLTESGLENIPNIQS